MSSYGSLSSRVCPDSSGAAGQSPRSLYSSDKTTPPPRRKSVIRSPPLSSAVTVDQLPTVFWMP